MTEEEKKVTMHLTAEAVKKLPPLHKKIKNLNEKELDEAHRVADLFIKIGEMRISFFEKIILLAGGSFALSLTFLGSLQRHNLGSPIRALWSLEVSWVLLLFSIVLSWLHNRHRCSVVEFVISAIAARKKGYYESQRADLFSRVGSAFKGVEILDHDLTDLYNAISKITAKSSRDSAKMADQMIEVAEKSWKRASKLGDFALLSVACAFLLMIWFAVRNASLL